VQICIRAVFFDFLSNVTGHSISKPYTTSYISLDSILFLNIDVKRIKCCNLKKQYFINGDSMFRTHRAVQSKAACFKYTGITGKINQKKKKMIFFKRMTKIVKILWLIQN